MTRWEERGLGEGGMRGEERGIRIEKKGGQGGG